MARNNRAETKAFLASKGGWGEHGSESDVRYMKRLSGSKWPKCGHCDHPKNNKTHIGMANGVGLMSGCEFHVAMWVRHHDELRRAGE